MTLQELAHLLHLPCGDWRVREVPPAAEKVRLLIRSPVFIRVAIGPLPDFGHLEEKVRAAEIKNYEDRTISGLGVLTSSRRRMESALARWNPHPQARSAPLVALALYLGNEARRVDAVDGGRNPREPLSWDGDEIEAEDPKAVRHDTEATYDALLADFRPLETIQQVVRSLDDRARRLVYLKYVCRLNDRVTAWLMGETEPMIGRLDNDIKKQVKIEALGAAAEVVIGVSLGSRTVEEVARTAKLTPVELLMYCEDLRDRLIRIRGMSAAALARKAADLVAQGKKRSALALTRAREILNDDVKYPELEPALIQRKTVWQIAAASRSRSAGEVKGQLDKAAKELAAVLDPPDTVVGPLAVAVAKTIGA